MEIWALILILLTIGLFLLPLIPSFLELLRPTDDAPLRVVQEYDANFQHFAQGFGRYINTNFAHMLSSHSKEATLDDGTEFQVMGEDAKANFESGKSLRKLLLSNYKLTLPDQVLYESEVYSKGEIRSGKGSYFRAMLAGGNILLEEDSTVLRWIHSDDTLYVQENCMLFGRASAGKNIVFAEHCGFERLQAPRIDFGKWDDSKKTEFEYPFEYRLVEDLRHTKSRSQNRWLVEGNVTLPDESFFKGDIVARGSIDIHHSSRIEGSLKANGDLVLGEDVIVTGSIIATGKLYIHPGCRIKGPVIAEETITVCTNVVVGTPEHPTTVCAPWIDIECGTRFFGTIWCGEEGAVEPAGSFGKNGRRS